MTELGVDPRAIAPDAPQYNATLVRRDDQHDSLGYFWVRFDGDPTPFMSGPVHDDRRVRRRQARPATVLRRLRSGRRRRRWLRDVRPPGGRRMFTPLLWRLPVGHRMRMIGPKGKFTPRARRRPDPPLHLDRDRQRAVRVDDASRCARAGRAGRCSSTACRTRPTWATDRCSRAGRRPANTRSATCQRCRDPAIRRMPAGRAERAGPKRTSAPVLDELGLTPANTIAYICGNPDMILAAEAMLLEARLPRAAGQEGALLAEGQGTEGRPGGPRREIRNYCEAQIFVGVSYGTLCLRSWRRIFLQGAAIRPRAPRASRSGVLTRDRAWRSLQPGAPEAPSPEGV